MTPPAPYTSHLSIPYPSSSPKNPQNPHHPLQTLDLHTRTPSSPPPRKTHNILYIHGGAFRDPRKTSLSLLPSLPKLFANSHIGSVASVNYRLSAYIEEGGKRREGTEGQEAKWPDHINDVRSAVGFLLDGEGEGEGLAGGAWRGKEWIVVGHSVGGTMGMMLGLRPLSESKDWGDEERALPGLKAVVAIAGIYDFGRCRDAHPAHRGIYDAFTTAAFGAEEEGGWERGNVVKGAREREGRAREGVEVVLVCGSRGDENVEWEQGERMVGVLGQGNGGKGEGVRVELVEVGGGHDEIVDGGVVIPEVVGRVVRMLVDRDDGEKEL
ncbi:hypothetical protein ACLMJK_003904 [Lecanora helva]